MQTASKQSQKEIWRASYVHELSHVWNIKVFKVSFNPNCFEIKAKQKFDFLLSFMSSQRFIYVDFQVSFLQYLTGASLEGGQGGQLTTLEFLIKA